MGGTVWSHHYSISFLQTADDRHFCEFQALSMLYIWYYFEVCQIVLYLTVSPWNLTQPHWHTTASSVCSWFNTVRPRGSRHQFADDIFKCIFLNENVWISINILLKFIPKGPINNIPALVQMMAWRRPGVKPLSEQMMDSLLTYPSLSVNEFYQMWCIPILLYKANI